jgi:hypothetical protein
MAVGALEEPTAVVTKITPVMHFKGQTALAFCQKGITGPDPSILAEVINHFSFTDPALKKQSTSL